MVPAEVGFTQLLRALIGFHNDVLGGQIYLLIALHAPIADIAFDASTARETALVATKGGQTALIAITFPQMLAIVVPAF